MASWPRTFRLVRHGKPVVVTASGPEDLWPIRMGLELVVRLGESCDDAVADRLRVMLRRLLTAGQPEEGRACRRLSECLAILADARAPENRAAIAEIDAGFPRLLTSTDMSEIEKEKQRFEEELNELAAAGDAEDVDAILAALEKEQAAAAPEDGSAAGACDAGASDEVDDARLDALLAAAEGDGPAEMPEASLEDSLEDIEQALSRAEDILSAGENLSEEEAGRILAGDADALADEEAAGNEAVQSAAPSDGSFMREPPAPTDAAEPAGSGPAAPPSCESSAGAADAPGLAAQDEAETLAGGLVGDDADLEAIASAFEEAASELDGLKAQVQQAVGPAEDAFEPAAEGRFLDDDLFDEAAGAGTPEAGEVADGPGASGATAGWGHKTVPVQPAADAAAAMNPSPTRSLREEIESVRNGLMADLDRVMAVLDGIDRTRQAADEAYARAVAFRDAAAEGVQAVEAMAGAQMEAAAAREAYERAQQRLQEARKAWEQIRARMLAAEQAASGPGSPAGG